MRRSLRRRLFQAIGLIVALSVAITLALGLVLTRRAVQDATIKDLAHQAALDGVVIVPTPQDVALAQSWIGGG